jgi:hypothetical protein
MKLWDFLPDFVAALEEQIRADDQRWGDTWLKRTRKGQEERTIKSLRDKFDQYENAGVPIPWLKIAGEALIAWTRERHPEIWPE